ncbi:SSI family serine proteinase inhibitor [Streptomyces sp. NPDC088745]|uniref:SSI family serine proteinase inhibitor n=1 Tax=Streptomyces sp. NPDC088745 TaxID=3365884 RepID=UPI003803D24B
MSAVRNAARRALVAAAASAALFASAGGATAHETPAQETPARTAADRHSGNWMHVAVVEGEDALSEVRGVLLRCPSATVPGHENAAEACRRLDAVDGDIARIERADVVCPMIYQPVTAMAYGNWDGRRMAFAKTYPNPCVLRASTGAVFTTGHQYGS